MMRDPAYDTTELMRLRANMILVFAKALHSLGRVSDAAQWELALMECTAVLKKAGGEPYLEALGIAIDFGKFTGANVSGMAAELERATSAVAAAAAASGVPPSERQ